MPPVRPNLAFSAAWRATIDEPSPAAGADRARFAARGAPSSALNQFFS